MSATHPSPFSYQKNKDVDEDVIGWFALTFNADINHEYIFKVYKNNKILKEYDFDCDGDEVDEDLFFKYLTHPDLHSVIFTRIDGVQANYKW